MKPHDAPEWPSEAVSVHCSADALESISFTTTANIAHAMNVILVTSSQFSRNPICKQSEEADRRCKRECGERIAGGRTDDLAVARCGSCEERGEVDADHERQAEESCLGGETQVARVGRRQRSRAFDHSAFAQLGIDVLL